MKFNGKNHREFTIRAFGKDHRVIVTKEQYVNGKLALAVTELTEENGEIIPEPFGMLTVNLDKNIQSDTRAFVKNYSENEGWAESLACQIGRPEGIYAACGYAIVQLYSFDLDKIYES